MYDVLSKQQIKWISSLKQKKFRQIHQVFVAENTKIVQDLILSGFMPDLLVFSEDKTKLIEDFQFPKSTSCFITTNEAFSKISSFHTPNGLLAVFKNFNGVEDYQASQFLYLDGINDPGNLGTIIRIADWYGLKQIFCSDSTVEAYNPKVVQSSMGSIGSVMVFYQPLQELCAQLSNYELILTTPNAQQSVYDFTKPKHPIIIVIGSESHGVQQDYFSLPHTPLSIPRIGKAESLNAAISTAIILDNLIAKQIR